MHVLPKGFHHIRYYGLLANGSRAENVAKRPVVAQYSSKVSRIYFRADAGFANPEVYEYRRVHQVCDPASGQPQWRAPILCELHLSGRKLDEAAPRRCQGGMASGGTLSARRLHMSAKLCPTEILISIRRSHPYVEWVTFFGLPAFGQ
jgi:hypothetical protein